MPPARRQPVWGVLRPEKLDPSTRETITGLGLHELLVNESSWVHRRVETYEFVDERTVRRQMSVDFTLPEGNRLVQALFALETPFVPLTTLRKAPIGHLNVWAEDGGTLPVFTTEQNGRLAGACLFGIARNVVRARKPGDRSDLTAAVAHALRQVALLPPNDAEYLLGCMLRHGAEKKSFQRQTWLAHCWDGWRPDEYLRALVAALDLHRDILDAALTSSTLRTLLTEMASQFILAVPVSRETLSRRQVLKFAYDEPIGLSGSRSPVPLYGERALASFSYAPAEYNFTGLAIGKSSSHHVEVIAPSQLEIATMTFDGAAASPAYKKTVRCRGVGQRAHANLGDAPRSATGTVTVELRAERAGLLRAAPLLAALVLGSLILLTSYASKVQNDAAAAMLLVVPGVIAALIIRPGEHRLATSVLLGVRALVIASALCAFIAAAYIATGFQYGALHRHLVPLTWVSAGLLVLLVLSYLLPRAQKP